MVEILCEKTAFSKKDESQSVSGTVSLINFRRLQLEQGKETGQTGSNITVHGECFESRDLFHSIAGVYSSALPDMELEAIYGVLTKPSQTIIVIATKKDIISYRQKFGAPPPLVVSKTPNIEVPETNEGEESEEDPFCKLFSDSEEEEEYVQSGEEEENEAEGGNFEEDRSLFLERVKKRRTLEASDPDSIGIEDRLIGCLTFMKLSSKPEDTSTQILLLAVRHRWRKFGVGGYLVRLCKDPSIIGQYDVIVTYADHNAEKFFSRHGFSEDPIITAKYRRQADYWENSTLMAYIPPYSTQTISSLRSVELLEDQLRRWRVMSMAAHSEQVCVMERLRQEVLLLMGRVSSQQEVIDALHKELRDCKRSYHTLEVEYELYRLQTQSKLVSLMEERARKWIRTTEEDMTYTNKEWSEPAQQDQQDGLSNYNLRLQLPDSEENH